MNRVMHSTRLAILHWSVVQAQRRASPSANDKSTTSTQLITHLSSNKILPILDLSITFRFSTSVFFFLLNCSFRSSCSFKNYIWLCDLTRILLEHRTSPKREVVVISSVGFNLLMTICFLVNIKTWSTRLEKFWIY